MEQYEYFSGNGPFNVDTDDMSVINNFCRFLYTGTFNANELNRKQLDSLQSMANTYLIIGLKQMCRLLLTGKLYDDEEDKEE